MLVAYGDGAEYMIGLLQKAWPTNGPRFVKFSALGSSSPDIIIYSLFGNEHKKYGNCRKILICGEPSNVSGYVANLLIDCKKVPGFQVPGASFAYVPFYVTSFFERFQNTPQDLLLLKPRFPKTKFCAFLYSQEHAHRNALFDQLNAYKKVDALGKCRGNGQPTDRGTYKLGVCTYNDLAVQKYKPYKFVICCENTRQPGYVTEKVVSAMLADAIPIYWGAPDIAEHFNPNSFINAGEPGWLEKVKAVDSNPEAYAAMLKEPWLKDNVLNTHFDCRANLKHALEKAAHAKAAVGGGSSGKSAAFMQLRKR